MQTDTFQNRLNRIDLFLYMSNLRYYFHYDIVCNLLVCDSLLCESACVIVRLMDNVMILCRIAFQACNHITGDNK